MDIDRIWKDSEHKPKTVELISLMKNTKFELSPIWTENKPNFEREMKEFLFLIRVIL